MLTKWYDSSIKSGEVAVVEDENEGEIYVYELFTDQIIWLTEAELDHMLAMVRGQRALHEEEIIQGMDEKDSEEEKPSLKVVPIKKKEEDNDDTNKET